MKPDLPEISDETEAAWEYLQTFGREPPLPYGLTDERRAAFYRRCVAEGNPDLDAWADLPDGAVS